MWSDINFCPTLANLYKERRVVGRSGKVFEEVGSLSTVNNISRIRALMIDMAPERTLEIGMAFGGSALTFAASHRDLGRTPQQQHTQSIPHRVVIGTTRAGKVFRVRAAATHH